LNPRAELCRITEVRVEAAKVLEVSRFHLQDSQHGSQVDRHLEWLPNDKNHPFLEKNGRIQFISKTKQPARGS
jgi:hypothetical protein